MATLNRLGAMMENTLYLLLAELKADHLHVPVEVHVKQLGDEEDVLVRHEEVQEIQDVHIVRKV